MPNTTAVKPETSGSKASGRQSDAGHDSGDEGGQGGLDGIHEAEPVADEAAGEQVAAEPGGQGEQCLAS